MGHRIWGVGALALSIVVAATLGAAGAARYAAANALRLSAYDAAMVGLTAFHNSLLEVEQHSDQAVYVEEWQVTLQTMSEGLDNLGVGLPGGPAKQAVESYRLSAGLFLDSLAMGLDPDGAAVDERFVAAAEALGMERRQTISVISDTGMRATLVNSVGGVAAGLFLPLVALLGYRAAARRQVSAARQRIGEEADSRLRQDREHLLSGFSHELRTPLTGITGFADLLRSAQVAPDEMAEMVEIIAGEAADLSRKVDDIIVASRSQHGELSYLAVQVDVREAVTDALLSLELVPNDVNIPKQTAVVADPQRLHHVLRNLMFNARQHGGSQLVVSAIADEGTVSIVVADNGDGLDGEGAEAFKGFSAGDRAVVTGSVGLGLFVARSLMEGMGGSLEYLREDGWTRFVARLPEAPPRELRWSDLRGIRNA